ncbi:MAG: dihydroorotate dehydrogenase electron transfer subunit [Chloroflexi bacterium]|nr:dihydroorotate dehydrogenase electron transfer subunit [Chloroflexota bacterium]
MFEVRSEPLIATEELAPGVRALWLPARMGAVARAGQFVMVRCGWGTDPLLARPMSIYRATPDAVAILIKIVGRGTTWLGERRPGDVVEFFGPLGRPFDVEPGVRNLLLVAGGIGIAPLVLLSDQAIARGCSVTMLIGALRSADLYPSHRLPPQVEVAVATNDGSAGHRGLVTDLLPEYLGWADAVYACGPRPMYETMAGFFRRNPTQKSVQIAWEESMGCGTGVCLGCVVATRRGYERGCVEGPVFELRDVAL